MRNQGSFDSINSFAKAGPFSDVPIIIAITLYGVCPFLLIISDWSVIVIINTTSFISDILEWFLVDLQPPKWMKIHCFGIWKESVWWKLLVNHWGLCPQSWALSVCVFHLCLLCVLFWHKVGHSCRLHMEDILGCLKSSMIHHNGMSGLPERHTWSRMPCIAASLLWGKNFPKCLGEK